MTVVYAGARRLHFRWFEAVLDLIYIVFPVFFLFIGGSADEEEPVEYEDVIIPAITVVECQELLDIWDGLGPHVFQMGVPLVAVIELLLD